MTFAFWKRQTTSPIHESPTEDSWRKYPVQLHDFVLFNSLFLDKPEEIVAMKGSTTLNQKLANSTFYPLFYDSNPKTLDLLSLLVSDIRPSVVVETGVANGTSTRSILTAFQNNNLMDSKLFSFDVDSRVATSDLLENGQFNFVLIGEKRFVDAMADIEFIDIFYHDSDHSYENQMLEYNLAWEKIRDGGALVSDDINWSNAFLDFCIRIKRPPLILADTEKFCGVVYKL
jgi:predicted O-methyltransferase YrrM